MNFTCRNIPPPFGIAVVPEHVDRARTQVRHAQGGSGRRRVRVPVQPRVHRPQLPAEPVQVERETVLRRIVDLANSALGGLFWLVRRRKPVA